MPATGSRRWRPRWTLRLRLTALYGSLFLIAGAILLAITYGLVAHGIGGVSEDKQFVVRSKTAKLPGLPLPSPSKGQVAGAAVAIDQGANGVQLRAYAGKLNSTFTRASAKEIEQLSAQAKAALSKQRSDELGSLLTESGIALGIMALVSIGLGWLIAGRALRPVRTMSSRARGITERNLHERLGFDGPNDELKELGDTFDELLGRLETAFESQRRFVSNASHELRTPITFERTLVEVALADPDASVESLQDTCRRVLAAGEQQERLIEALLTLARSQRGLEVREDIDLSELAAEAIGGVDADGVSVDCSLGEARTHGDPRLVERLIANLLENALKYNDDRGWVSVWTGVRAGRAVLEVLNAGASIEPERVDEMLEPFRRLNGDRSVPAEPLGRRGLGLGLSIVVAIAEAHDAGVSVAPREEGGLRVQVSFPGVWWLQPGNRAAPQLDRVPGV